MECANADDPQATGRSIRGGGRSSSNGRVVPGGYGRQPTYTFQAELEHLETEAYTAVVRAFGAQSEAITWVGFDALSTVVPGGTLCAYNGSLKSLLQMCGLSLCSISGLPVPSQSNPEPHMLTHWSGLASA